MFCLVTSTKTYKAKFWVLLWMLVLAQHAGRAQELPLMKQGLMDLRGISLQDTTLALSGEVAFYWMTLADPQSLQNGEYLPSYDKDFPSAWNNRVIGADTLSARGYATYKMRLLLPKEALGKRLGLQVQDMYLAYKLYVNGYEKLANGQVGTSPADYEPFWLPQTTTFVAQSDTLELVLQIANFHHSTGGIREAIIFGDAELITRQFSNDLAYDYVLTGCLVMGGLFFLGLYFFGKGDKATLFFALFCIAYGYWIIASGNYALHHMNSSIPWWLALRVEYIALYLAAFFFVRFTALVYPGEASRGMMKVYQLIPLLLLLSPILLPMHLYTLAPPLFVGFIVAFLPYCVYIYIRAIINKRHGAAFALISMLIMFAGYAIITLNYFNVLYVRSFVLFFSLASFVFFQSLIVSFRYAMSYRSVVREAEKASLMKTEFLSVMSHEIRTPLNAVVGMSNLLKAEGEQKENVNTLKGAAQNLLVLINNILDYTKIESEKVEFEALDTHLPELLENLRLTYSARAIEENLNLELKIGPNTPEYIVCDPTRLNQVLSNLVGNGLKFTERGSVIISVNPQSTRDDSVVLRFMVEDTGIGIAKDKQELIYETFTQASSATNRNYGGTGLGLSIIQKLLRLQGTELHLESEIGVGSTFYFDQEFKLGSLKQVVQPKASDYSDWGLLQGKRLLLVEDNPVNIVVARKFLERWKAHVDVAMSGEEVMDLTIDHDLILMDLQMPDMDGYTISQKLREQGVKIPILAFTASALFDVREKIAASGMNDYVIKPFDPEDLYRKLVKQTV